MRSSLLGRRRAAVDGVTRDERARDRIAFPTEEDVPCFRKPDEIARERVVVAAAFLHRSDERGGIRFKESSGVRVVVGSHRGPLFAGFLEVDALLRIVDSLQDDGGT